MLAATATLLKRWGCEVAEFTGLPEAACGCDAIVSDFDLGGDLDGLDVVARLREMEGWEVLAAILTGRSEPETLKRLAYSGILSCASCSAPGGASRAPDRLRAWR